MTNLKNYLSSFTTYLMAFAIVLFSLASPLSATNSDLLTIMDVEYTTNTVFKGDSFSVNFDFYVSTSANSSNLSIKSITASGEAVNASKAKYTVTTDGYDKTKTFSSGQVISVSFTDLIYTGIGSEVEIKVSAGNATGTYSFNLNTMSTQDVAGSLVLDSSITNNLSLSMNAGESKRFNLQVKNVASESIKNGVAKVYFSDTTPGLAITSGQYTNLSSISSGATQTLSFSVSADSSVKSGTYKLIIELNNMRQEALLCIDSNITPPVLELSIDASSKFTLGEINPITINVKNSGGKAAKNIKIKILNNSNLAVVGNSNVKNISSLAAGSSTSYSEKIQLDTNQSNSLVQLQLEVSYTDESGEAFKDSQNLFLNTSSTALLNDMSIYNVISPSGEYTPGQDFNIKFTISSKHGAEDVKVSILPDTGLIAKSQNVFMLDTLAKGASKQYEVKLSATDSAKTGNHPIQILLEYEYDNKPFSMSQYASIYVDNEEEEEDENKVSAKVIVDNYTVSPTIVKAGEDVSIDLSFLNTHPNKTIYNLTASVNLQSNSSASSNTTGNGNGNTSSMSTSTNSNIFYTASSRNTLFSAMLSPNSTYSSAISLHTLASADPGTYMLTLDISYEDEDGNKLSTTDSIPIVISQDISIDIAQIDLDTLSIGRSTALTATIYNTSPSDISNVMISIESDGIGDGFTITDNKCYLSVFSKGATQYYAPTLKGVAAGHYDAQLIITYDNNLGNTESINYPFTIEVADGKQAGGYMTRPDNATKGNMPGSRPSLPQKSSTNIYLICGIIIILAAALFVAIKYFKKKKSHKDFNIDE